MNINSEVREINDMYRNVMPLEMTEENEELHINSSICCIWDKEFTDEVYEA